MSLTVGPARADERVEAFRLYFQQVPEDERAGRVDRGLELVASGQVAPDGVLVCRQGGRIVGAMVGLALPGGAGLAWPPQVLRGFDQVLVEDRLIEFTCGWLRQRGCKFAQVLLATQEPQLAEPLQRHGFRHVTILHYLQKTLEAQDDLPALRLDYRTWSFVDAALFPQTLERSYRHTLDCPELNEVRDVEDVMAGYQAMPGYRPDRWWLAWQDDQAVGILITVELQEQQAWELLYVGLVPEARGRRLGQEMTRKAMHEAWSAGAERLTLTVDDRNAPARQTYAALGFEAFDRRAVLLRIFR